MRLLKLASVLLAFSAVLISCKKDEPEEVTPLRVEVNEQGSNDETARNEYDRSIDGVFNALEKTSFGSRGTDSSGVILPCGVVKIDTTGGKYTIQYGKNCGRKVLSGSITATLASKNNQWKDTNAVMKITYNNYTVKFDVNQETLVFNGDLFVTNLNGGQVFEIITAQKRIVHKLRGAIKITFDNGATRTWHVFKKRTYSSASNQPKDVQLEIAADSTGKVAEWGLNKNGDQFVTTIPVPLKMENCTKNNDILGPFVMTNGQAVYTVAPNSLKIEAGHKFVNGNVQTDFGCGSTGYKLTWTINGKTKTEFQYY